MKLHLPKGIRTALLACVCMFATSAWAATTIELGGAGTKYENDITVADDVIISGAATRIGDETNGDGLSINNTGTLTFSVTDTVELGAWPNTGASPTTIGSSVTDITFASGYTYLTCGSKIQNSGSITINENAKFGINSGTSITLNSAITNKGTLQLDGGTITLATGVIDNLDSK